MLSARTSRFLDFAFIVAFAVLALLPILCFDFSSTVSEQENRTLAPPPDVLSFSAFNAHVFESVDAWLADRFGLRQPLITLENRIQSSLFRSLVGEFATQGRENWFFFMGENNLRDYLKLNRFSTGRLSAFESRLVETATWCENNGFRVLFLVAPNKHSVYSEFHPLQRPAGPSRADQIASLCSSLDIPLVYPLDALLNAKRDSEWPLYYETDTHWNAIGAHVAAGEVIGVLHDMFPAVVFPSIVYQTNVVVRQSFGDLNGKSGRPDLPCTVPTVSPDPATPGGACIYLKNGEGENSVVHTRSNNGNLPRAMVFRDSFFSLLEPFLSPMFSEAECIWHPFTDADKPHVLEFAPDIVIFESVERNAETIAGPVSFK